jgi:hypothetical protein
MCTKSLIEIVLLKKEITPTQIVQPNFRNDPANLHKVDCSLYINIVQKQFLLN